MSNDWGEMYGGEIAYHDLDGKPVQMRRKGQRVRFFVNGEQIGPEQSNVGPAVAYAHSQGWTSPSLPWTHKNPFGGK